jgi:hypothetical protein
MRIERMYILTYYVLVSLNPLRMFNPILVVTKG